jgi:hypothetical protein
MKTLLFFLALLLPLQALTHERSFDKRVQQAKQIEDTPDGRAYQKALWEQVGDFTSKAMQH